jgi:thiol-disulfide isomerase/thioredoxin
MVFFFCALPALATRQVSFQDLQGVRHTIPDQQHRATVLVFITQDCPISNSYIPELKRIYEAYAAQNIGFYFVYVDPTASAGLMKKHAVEYGLPAPQVDDAKHELVSLVGATITPEVAVLDPVGKLLYLGRIDDLYVDVVTRRPEPTRRDLRDVLDAVLAGKPIASRTTQAVGCFIPSVP